MAHEDMFSALFLLSHPNVDLRAISVSGTGEAHCGPGVRNALGPVAVSGKEDIPVTCGRETPLADYEGVVTNPATGQTVKDPAHATRFIDLTTGFHGPVGLYYSTTVPGGWCATSITMSSSSPAPTTYSKAVMSRSSAGPLAPETVVEFSSLGCGPKSLVNQPHMSTQCGAQNMFDRTGGEKMRLT